MVPQARRSLLGLLILKLTSTNLAREIGNLDGRNLRTQKFPIQVKADSSRDKAALRNDNVVSYSGGG